jgi:hypothetical protein
MELRALIIQACNEISQHMRRRVTVRVEEVARRNGRHIETWFTDDKSTCNGPSFCMSVSSIVTEIKILLIDQVLDHFVHYSVDFNH